MASTYTFTDAAITNLAVTTDTVTTVVPTTITVGSGGLTPISAPSGICNKPIATATDGTNTTPADGTQFVTSIWIPVNMTLTGVAYLVGGTGGTNKVYAVLYDSTGAV